MNIILDNSQSKAKEEVKKVIQKYGICYLFGEPRSGKTFTVLFTANELGFKNVLFLTRKKSISSIQKDFKATGFEYNLEVINYESVHKVEFNPDFIIYDEAHVLGSYPKPNKTAKYLRSRYKDLPCLLMSGTPAIESLSQYFHQFYVSLKSPFFEFKNFYRFADVYVNKKQKRIGTHTINDYSEAREELINKALSKYIITLKKNKEMFGDIKVTKLRTPMPRLIERIANDLKRHKTVVGKEFYIMGETPAKLLGKLHQIYNGTVMVEDDFGETKAIILSDYKARLIKDRFQGNKIAIMYYFRKELEMLKEVFGDEITEDLEEFNNTDKNIALQQRTTEGVNLGKADYLVFLNFGFSGKDFTQSIDRLTVRGRESMEIYFIFEEGGIMEDVYNTVSEKKDFNTKEFKKYAN